MITITIWLWWVIVGSTALIAGLISYLVVTYLTAKLVFCETHAEIGCAWCTSQDNLRKENLPDA